MKLTFLDGHSANKWQNPGLEPKCDMFHVYNLQVHGQILYWLLNYFTHFVLNT